MELIKILKLADMFDKLAAEKKVYWKVKGTNKAGKHHTEVIYADTEAKAKKSFTDNNEGFKVTEVSVAKDIKK